MSLLDFFRVGPAADPETASTTPTLRPELAEVDPISDLERVVARARDLAHRAGLELANTEASEHAAAEMLGRCRGTEAADDSDANVIATVRAERKLEAARARSAGARAADETAAAVVADVEARLAEAVAARELEAKKSALRERADLSTFRTAAEKRWQRILERERAMREEIAALEADFADMNEAAAELTSLGEPIEFAHRRHVYAGLLEAWGVVSTPSALVEFVARPAEKLLDGFLWVSALSKIGASASEFAAYLSRRGRQADAAVESERASARAEEQGRLVRLADQWSPLKPAARAIGN
jgi:hypothetical protein